MIAVDTNVLVRLIMADDPRQSPKARELFKAHSIYLTKSVLLECEWVFRGAYKQSREAILRHFQLVIGLPQVQVECPDQIARAMDWFAQGMDFADALHLASGADCVSFASFDRKLLKRAAKYSELSVMVP
jgi:predicted nucleic-acid-binding protein